MLVLSSLVGPRRRPQGTACIKTPARCTARAELQLQNMADHGHHNATEADHTTTLGGRKEASTLNRPQTNWRKTSVSIRTIQL